MKSTTPQYKSVGRGITPHYRVGFCISNTHVVERIATPSYKLPRRSNDKCFEVPADTQKLESVFGKSNEYAVVQIRISESELVRGSTYQHGATQTNTAQYN